MYKLHACGICPYANMNISQGAQNYMACKILAYFIPNLKRVLVYYIANNNYSNIE